jgi:hypothetical protein
MICLYRKWKRYETHPGRSSCKTGARTNIGNEIFSIGFGTRIIATELDKQKQALQIRNKSLLIFVKCYIIITIIIVIIIINDGDVSVCGGGGGGDGVVF